MSLLGSYGWIFLILTCIYVLNAAPQRNFDEWKESRTPWGRVATIMNELRGFQCQRGSYNISDAFVDAVFHCADIEHTKVTRRHFGDETVDWDGETPLLCLKTCIIRESGAMNEESTGVNRERLHQLFFEGMRKPGGHMSAHILTEELLQCDTKHPTVFPKFYKNCTDTETVLRCYGKAFNNCRERKDEWMAENPDLDGLDNLPQLGEEGKEEGDMTPNFFD